MLLGIVVGHITPARAPYYLGNFLFWIKVPVSTVAFLHGTNLSGSIWIAPVIAWVAILLGAGFAWIWMQYQRSTIQWSRPTQGSFLLSTMVGNTGYLGYPIILTLLGPQYFAWALFYDLLGTTLGAYGLGVGIAAYYGSVESERGQYSWQLIQTLLMNPPLWSFLVALGLRNLLLPPLVDQTLQLLAWSVVALSLVLTGMRLGELSSWQSLPKAGLSWGIKMFLVPLLIGAGLSIYGLEGPPRLIVVLQTAMPPAFATLVITEAYQLDKDLTVTALSGGSIGILAMLPVWLWLFGI